MRFSLRLLFVAIFLIAISVVALLYANRYWEGVARDTLFLVFPIGAVIAILATGTTRAFWLGFSIVGAVQFWHLGFAAGEFINGSLMDEGISWLYSKVVKDVSIEVPWYDQAGKAIGTRPQIEQRPAIVHFRRVGYCIFAALSGVLGGCLAVWFVSPKPVAPSKPKDLSDNVSHYT